MIDQATRLRELAAAYRAQATSSRMHRTKAIAVTSGKGGVGKSNLSINLAHALIAAGKEVILLDADLGLANADILMGIVPAYHLGHLLKGERDILELIHRTPTRLKLIAGGSGLAELVNLSESKLRPFLNALSKLDGQADYLILDTGAGIGPAVQEFVLAADTALVVTTPEPTALADAYGAIKTLSRRGRDLDLRLVINQAEKQDEAAMAAERIITTARDFLGVNVEYLGTVPRDPIVWQAVRRQVPFIVGYPSAPASRAVGAMAARLLAGVPADPARSRPAGFFERLASLFGRRDSNAG